MPNTATLLLACSASLVAGFVDSIVGGGGLIQLPALLILFPDSSFAHLSSVNKTASCAGTLIALIRYRQHVALPRQRIIPSCLVALGSSALGALSAAYAPTAFMRGFALIASVGVMAFTIMRWRQTEPIKALPHIPDAYKVGVLALTVGFYDGFFGPGTGSFFVFGLVALLGLDFLSASAEAKALNLSTNIAAIAMFAAVGAFDPKLFVPLACCNIVGSSVGSYLAIRKGAPFVRGAFLVVVSLLMVKLCYELIRDQGLLGGA